MKLEKWHYEHVADALHDVVTAEGVCTSSLKWTALFPTPHFFHYEGELVAKERPRSTSKGKVYTPARTKKFEKSVHEAAKLSMEGKLPFAFPLSAEVVLHDPSDSKLDWNLSFTGVKFEQKKDADNIVKAIFDGCNKSLWYDDKQVVEMKVRRVYTPSSGFTLLLRRAGMTNNEITTMLGVYRRRYGEIPD